MSGSNTVSRICLYLILRYSLKDDGDVNLEGSIETQTLFHNLTTRLKYDELYVQVLHNGVSKYLELNALRVHPGLTKS